MTAKRCVSALLSQFCCDYPPPIFGNQTPSFTFSHLHLTKSPKDSAAIIKKHNIQLDLFIDCHLLLSQQTGAQIDCMPLFYSHLQYNRIKKTLVNNDHHQWVTDFHQLQVTNRDFVNEKHFPLSASLTKFRWCLWWSSMSVSLPLRHNTTYTVCLSAMFRTKNLLHSVKSAQCVLF